MAAARSASAPSLAGGNVRGVLTALCRRALQALGLGLVAAAGAIVVALSGYDPADPSWNHATDAVANNPLGGVGAHLADALLQSFGYAAYVVPFALACWGVRLIIQVPLAWPWLPVMALPFALLLTALYLAPKPVGLDWTLRTGYGGFVGDFLLFRVPPDATGQEIRLTSGLLALVALAATMGLRWREVGRLLATIGRAIARLAAGTGRGTAELWRRRGEFAPERPPWRRVDDEPGPAEAEPSRLAFAESRLSPSGFEVVGRLLARLAERLRAYHRRGAAEDDDEPGPSPAAPASPSRRARRRAPAKAAGNGRASGVGAAAVAAGGEDDAVELAADGGFRLPPMSLLGRPAADQRVRLDPRAAETAARELEKVLDDFGVRGEIVDVKPGPVVTLYELQPAPGTRAARVISLADDIARSLCARSVRVATVPGRNVIGIELPNPRRETVFLSELLASETYEDTAAKLTLALGKDIGGDPVVVDLARMPHLLIAGTTGSGKSVAVNAMILSLLYRLPPDQCKLIMIDPKVIELSVYEGIPHLLAPVVTEPGKAVVALKWVVREMDDRYRRMSYLNVRDTFSYNRRLAEAKARGETLTRRVQVGFEPETGAPLFEDQPLPMEPLPLVVVVVDEVADLMLTAGKEIEAAIQRLSQKARAAGIHLIVATQRPSVDVLTGVIKANLPSRISFRVSTKIDSRTILGEPGAEQLLGQGDMLFMMPGERIIRIHGPLVTEHEVERVVGYLKQQGQPNYIEAVTSEEAQDDDGYNGFGGGGADDDGADDSQYRQAVQVVAAEGKASTSFVQRKLRIGYNSAARLIERMEAEGLVSRPDHVGRRQVLIGGGVENAEQPGQW